MSHSVVSDNMKRIYLDHAAQAPLDPEVCSEMLPYFREYGNPSSLHQSGRQARTALEKARASIARCLHIDLEEIIFTSGGTESDNLAIVGVARAYERKGKHILLSAVEHKAVLESGVYLRSRGYDVEHIPVDEYGRINVKETLSLVRPDTILISIMLANNEIGTVEPIRELARELKKEKKHGEIPLLHTDACQAAGYLPLSPTSLGVDLMTISSSKIYGPKGIGILYRKKNIKLEPILRGGEQEGGFRAGTEPVALIVGIAAAIKKAEMLRATESLRLEMLRTWFIDRLKASIRGIRINGHPTEHLPHIVHVTVPSIEGESMALMCDAAKIEVATGSSCSSHDLSPSHVLIAIKESPEDIHGSLRFSMGRSTTKAELEYVLKVFPHIVEQLRAVTALTTKHYERKRNSIV